MSATNHKKSSSPKQNFFFGSALIFRKAPLNFLIKTAEEFPLLSTFRFAHLPMVFLSHPETIKHVLQTNNKNYKKGIEYEHLKPVLGEGLLTSEGDFWLRQRRLAQPAFHRDKIAHFSNQMVDCTNGILNGWKNKKVVDVHSEMMHLALDIVGKTLLSTNVLDEANEVEKALSVSIEESYHRVQALVNLPLWLPVPRHLRYNKSRDSLDKIVAKIINDRRKSDQRYNDLLEMLMDVQDEDTGEKMSDKQLRDEIMTIFLAGHETTANALTWGLYLLSQNPEVEKKYFEEIDRVLGNRTPSLEDLRNLPYLTQIIHEILRLYPPAWILGRTALEDDIIEGQKIKKGNNIIISPYQMHRSKDFWENPNDFIPDRFTPEKMKDMHKFLYFPFGGGPRFCIGNNFALMEMQLIFAMIGQKYKLTLQTGFEVEPDPLITLRPKFGMKMNLSPR
jgi:cytochrome P450